MTRGWNGAGLLAAVLLAAQPSVRGAAPVIPAEFIFRNAYVYTVDLHDNIGESIAVREGRILYVGDNAGVGVYAGPKTRVYDLGGRMVLPGIIDAHLHPLDGGGTLTSCNLDYQPLTVEQFQLRIRACLDERHEASGQWLQVSGWYRQFMRPAGTDVTAATLDALHTDRPILVRSTDGHSILANSRAMNEAKITAKTGNPEDGLIVRDADGQPTGIFEDGAGRLLEAALPPPNEAENLRRAQAALEALRRQGVTSFLDAAASEASMKAFSSLAAEGHLTARAHFAPVIDVRQANHTAWVVQRIQALQKRYDRPQASAKPVITVHHAKIFMDGVLQAPAQTAAVLEPYYVDRGPASTPRFAPGAKRGEVYFSQDVLQPLLVELLRAGIEPHIHAIGDRSVHEALDAVAAMRDAALDPTVRVAVAHAELVDPSDYARFASLEVTPVMSFQWAKPGPDSIDAARDFLGPARFAHLEPEGSLYAAHARIAFGSDWPVDRLNEWFALKVAVTRTGDPALGERYAGRFNDEAPLPRAVAVRAMTFNAAYSLHQDHQIGSLEAGKLADLVVIDRNVIKVRAEDIAQTKVLMTMVGGVVVYDSGALKLATP